MIRQQPQPRTHDTNGLEIAPILARFSDEELAAARRLARLHGHRHDLIGIDPGNMGWRFLRDAVVALGGKDPGRSPYAEMHRRGLRIRAAKGARP